MACVERLTNCLKILLTFAVNIIDTIGEMDIIFGSNKLERDCNEAKRARKRFGAKRAERLKQRLDELHAAEVLADMRTLPQARCHVLTQDRKGQLAVNLDHPYRLIFEPANRPVPKLPDGGIDWGRVTAVKVLEITDYHG